MRIFDHGASHLRALLLAAALLVFVAHEAAAQHHDHSHPRPTPAATPKPTPQPSPTPKPARDEAHGASHHAGATRGAGSGQHDNHAAADATKPAAVDDPHGAHGAPMKSPDGSGTSWQPASTPAYMLHRRAGEWTLMLHGEAKIGVNSQGGPRGVTKSESQNGAMQYSYGLLKNPELLHEGDTRRQTASVQYNRPLARGNRAGSRRFNRSEQEGLIP